MSRSAGNAWRAKIAAVAMILPLLALTGCGGGSDASMDEKLAAAQQAADKAVAAQLAAEKAAATAASIRPAPVAEPAAVADTNESPFDNDDNDNNGDSGSNEVSMGGEGASISADGVVVPGQGV